MLIKRVLAGCLLILIGTASTRAIAGGGCVWESFVSAPQPQTFQNYVIAHHEPTEQTVLFVEASAQTWTFDGSVWTLRLVPGPSARLGSSMVYDAARGVCLLFGGGFTLQDTWAWDGSAWTLLSNPGPVPRAYATMAYDAARQEVVLFGGVDQHTSSPLNDTWVWDGSQWHQKAPVSSPVPLYSAAMAFDEAGARVVLFGGYDELVALPPTNIDQTWQWDGEEWSLLPMSTPPRKRVGHAMSFDPERRAIVMTGGQDGGTPLQDTWMFKDGQWSQFTLANPRSGGLNQPLAYHPSIRRHVGMGRAASMQPTQTYLLNVEAVVAAHIPAPMLVSVGSTVVLECEFRPGHDLQRFQWRRDGIGLTDGNGVSGATTPTLTLTDVQASDMGHYTLLVHSLCGPNEFGVSLFVLCPGDTNGDGVTNFADLNLTISNFNTSCIAP
ncbi:MAG: hypothetical protein IBJ10_03135 [Phycisphaerales bacterium]|nr:hypothetical protein [Phycisphaerales bacterium]